MDTNSDLESCSDIYIYIYIYIYKEFNELFSSFSVTDLTAAVATEWSDCSGKSAQPPLSIFQTCQWNQAFSWEVNGRTDFCSSSSRKQAMAKNMGVHG